MNRLRYAFWLALVGLLHPADARRMVDDHRRAERRRQVERAEFHALLREAA